MFKNHNYLVQKIDLFKRSIKNGNPKPKKEFTKKFIGIEKPRMNWTNLFGTKNLDQVEFDLKLTRSGNYVRKSTI